MNQDFFSDINKNLLHNLIKNKIMELDNINIDTYPELKQNLESTLISVYRNKKYSNIVNFNKDVLSEGLIKIRQIIKSPKNKDIDNIDNMINIINQTKKLTENPQFKNNMFLQSNGEQRILDNIQQNTGDEVRNMYERTVNMRTPSKEKPTDIDFAKPSEPNNINIDDEYNKKMKERDNLPVFHSPPNNNNNEINKNE